MIFRLDSGTCPVAVVSLSWIAIDVEEKFVVKDWTMYSRST